MRIQILKINKLPQEHFSGIEKEKEKKIAGAAA